MSLRSVSAAFAAALLASAPAHAVIILDSTWAEEGGTADNPSAGFEAAKALAGDEAYASTVAFSSDGEFWGACSGTWIGNDGETAYVLTAAHCFGADSPPESFKVLTTGGAVFDVVSGVIHEAYVDSSTTTGRDLAIVALSGPITDVAEPAVLYGGSAEKGQLLTFMGYGSRGIGSEGQQDKFHDGENDKAAAQGIIDVVNATGTGDDGGNYLGVFLPKEDGSVPNEYGGAATPVNRLAGLLGSGDSGGSAFLEIDGQTVLAGINSNGTGNATYGETSWFVRVSGARDWILANAPVATFSE